jgi:type 1 glutamine amidotransferase
MSTRLLVAAVMMLVVVKLYAAAERDQDVRRQPAEAACATSPSDADRPCVLIFTRTAGFRHASIPDGVKALRERLGTAWTVYRSDDPATFTREGLARFRAIVFLSTTGDVIDDAQQHALTEWVLAGGGWIGIHAAADTEHQWPWYGEQLCCARLVTHPAVQRSTVIVEDRAHPSTSMLPERWERTDEWYVYDRSPRTVDGVRALASMDGSTIIGPRMEGDHPIAWCRDLGKGRAWYTGGGHTSESFAEPLFLDHIEGGIRWAARISAEGDAAERAHIGTPAQPDLAPPPPASPKETPQ